MRQYFLRDNYRQPNVVLTSIVGIASISAGLEGYILSKLNRPQRILLVAGGAAAALSSGLAQITTGVAIVVAILWHVVSVKTIHQAPVLGNMPKVDELKTGKKN